MPSPVRYEILESIASGDYATVYRGRDQELSRDVAIKQIHQQFLADPRQLDRYWQEAQLLASLQHPHIMTIYDLVRERGWLILELMHGSLTKLLAGRPIDLKDLRLTLNYTLQALQTMHRHGIVHGDVKPSNLLVDRNQRVKLGDFGIARRIAGEGSVVKGTTKYIAPEVVSDQFGPVGPHSDIYSLGFTAYELMCGEHFETLFPGLNMYGRDRQMAWMMWHSALDRRLPEVSRVLEGVPADLAFIIQKMTEKDPAKRYRSSDEVLADLKLDGQPPPVGPTPEERSAAELQARSQRRRRSWVIAATACSLVLSIGMLFLPSLPNTRDVPRAKSVSHPTSGEVVELDKERSRVFVKPPQGETQAVVIRPGLDRVFLNGQQVALEQLDQQDQLQIASSSRDGKEFLMIEATRAAAEEYRGPVVSLDPSSQRLIVASDAGAGESKEFAVGEHVSIEINGETKREGRPLGLADLLPQDQVMVRFKSSAENPPAAALIKAVRQLTTRGFVVEVGGGQVKLRIAETWDAPNAREQSWKLAENCPVSLNGQASQEGRTLTPSDLLPRDLVTIEHDMVVRQITALRETEVSGVIASVDSEQRTLTIAEGNDQAKTWAISANTRIEIAGTQLQGDFKAFRSGDAVTLHRRSPNPNDNEARFVSVTPRPDPRNWALILEQSSYDNPRLPAVPFATEDATELHATLRFRYRVPESQCLRERNATRVRLENALNIFLGRIPADAQVTIFCVGLGFVDSTGTGYLAPQGFDEMQADATGIKIRWLVEHLESCAAQEKLLILDTSHDMGKPQTGGFVSAGELAESARIRPGYPISTSVAVLASGGPGSAGRKVPDQRRGAFSLALTSALSGKADADGNQQVSAQELAAFVRAEVPRLIGNVQPSQVPLAFWPDAKPPRISVEARAAVLRLFEYFLKWPQESPTPEFEAAVRLCEGQPDAHLVYALLLIRQEKSPQAIQVLEQVRLAFPHVPVSHELYAWLTFRRGELKQGVAQLEQLIRRLPPAEKTIDREYSLHAATFAGRMVGYGWYLAPPERRLTNADLTGLREALNEQSEPVRNAFRESFRALEAIPQEFDQRIAESNDATEKMRLTQQRTSFHFHVPLDIDAVRDYLRASLDR